PGLSDHVIMVRGRARAFLAGPPLLRAATGEIATDEELGGAEMHTSVSGLGEYLAQDDADAIRIAREVVGRLGFSRPHAGADALQRESGAPNAADNGFAEPAYDPDELAGVVPLDFRQPFD